MLNEWKRLASIIVLKGHIGRPETNNTNHSQKYGLSLKKKKIFFNIGELHLSISDCSHVQYYQSVLAVLGSLFKDRSSHMSETIFELSLFCGYIYK